MRNPTANTKALRDRFTPGADSFTLPANVGEAAICGA
jgi:hypothetical protein